MAPTWVPHPAVFRVRVLTFPLCWSRSPRRWNFSAALCV